MPFLSKDLLSSYNECVPYPEVQDAFRRSPEYIQKVHEDALADHFKSVANMLCLRNSRREDKPLVIALDPCAFHYYLYGQQKFLSSHLRSLLGSPEEAEIYYKQRYNEAFPGFEIDVKRRANEEYAYTVVIA